MKLLLMYEGTDSDELSKVTWNWASNEEIEDENADWILNLIRTGEIWSTMDGIPEDWRVLGPDDSDEDYDRSDYLVWMTAYEMDEDGDCDWDKPVAKSKRYVIVTGEQEKEA